MCLCASALRHWQCSNFVSAFFWNSWKHFLASRRKFMRISWWSVSLLCFNELVWLSLLQKITSDITVVRRWFGFVDNAVDLKVKKWTKSLHRILQKFEFFKKTSSLFRSFSKSLQNILSKFIKNLSQLKLMSHKRKKTVNSFP